MKVNLALVTLYFCCGIIFVHFIKVSFWFIYSIAFCLLIACFLSIRKDFIRILFPCLIFVLGSLLLKNTYILPKSHISKFVFYKNDTIYTVKGFINSQPGLNDGKGSFMFATQELEFNRANHKCSGEILVHLKEIKGLSYGEALILRGSIHKPFKLYGDSVAAIMHVNTPGSVISLGKNYGQPLRKLAFYIKGGIERIIYQRLSALTASILDAMVLGEKRNIPAVVYDSMTKTGTVHILVVSGFNVGVVAYIIMLILKILRLPRTFRYLSAIFCLLIYCLATGIQAPVVRATIMTIFFLTGFLLKRETDIRNCFSLAALFILLINPRELFSISFQLSFASVAAIIFLYPRLKAFFKAESIKSKPLKLIAEGALVSSSCWLATLGLIAYNFRFFSPVTVVANIFIVPLATLITLSGFSLVFITRIFPALAGSFVYANEVLVFLLLRINNLLLHLPFAYLYW